jgi:hypothetical protein
LSAPAPRGAPEKNPSTATAKNTHPAGNEIVRLATAHGEHFHRAEGTAADAQRRPGHRSRLDRLLRGNSWLYHLYRHQGRTAFLYPHVDAGVNDRGIRFNTLSPGPTDTPSWMGKPTPWRARTRSGRSSPRDTAEPDGPPRRDCSGRAVFGLDGSSFVAGAELSVDGGMAQV